MNRTHPLLLLSAGLNIFLVAFLLGRETMPMLPPHNFMESAEHEHMHRRQMDGGMPAPFFGPSELFSREEMRDNAEHMQKEFKKLDALRKDFAAQLEKGPISEADVLKHFAQVDTIMAEIRSQTQQKVAEKIGAMNADERKAFAHHLTERPE